MTRDEAMQVLNNAPREHVVDVLKAYLVASGYELDAEERALLDGWRAYLDEVTTP
ncbi:MAG: hypothetical protein NW206_19655 [Hyphomonadaceae bacterium]|nr:hypothetical protein [Hyphomonadaceae bacterium]